VVPKDWPTLKAELLAEGLQGTLPLIEFPDGTRVTQSVAAIRHFARLYKRYGSTEADATRCDVVADTVEDWRQDFDRVAYNPGRLDPTAVRVAPAYRRAVSPPPFRNQLGPTAVSMVLPACVRACVRARTVALYLLC
jgi:glutathione S-transferase